MFDRVRDTPVDMVARTTDALLMSQPHGRRVTFGAATASPSAPRPHRASFAAFQTPTAISEGDGSGSDADGGGDGVAGGSVNSHHAGATPFDRRLSAKFAKYGVGDGALDDEFQPFQDGAGPEGINVSGQIEKEGAAAVSEDDMDVSDASPASLRRLSGASAKKCIKELSKALAGVPPATQPAEASPATTPNTAIASVLGQLLRRSLEDIQAARAEGATCTTRPLLSGVISPTSGILRVAPEPPSSAKPDLAPVPSEPSTEHSQGGPSPGSMAATHSGTDCVATPDSAPSEVIDLSPASKGTTASTPELTPTASDGVPRDSWGVPIRTPGTVTLFRGTGGLPRRDDGIAADLTRCFTTPDTDPQADDRPGSGGFSFDLGRPRAAQGDMTPTPPSSGGDSSEGTPEFQPRSASRGGKRTSTAGVSGCSRPASIFRSPSAAPDDTAGMGKAQRVPSPAPVASVTRELRGLLRGMTLSSPSPGAEMTLSPVRAPHQLRQHTGASVVVTQVRRSPRLAARGDASQPGEGGVDALLQSVEYAYGESFG